MTFDISPNTQAILLLAAPLIVGRSTEKEPLLSHREYGALARALKDAHCAPADLVEGGDSAAREAAERVVARERLDKLLARGFKLAQALERWRARSIWVVSRADPAYPRRLKAHLRNDAPALLYGCGDAALLDRGGLAVVGSRKASGSVLAFTASVARGAAEAGRPIVSGGARGIDQAALDGSLEAGGWAIAVLADSLEKAATRRAYRTALRDGRLVLASPFDPAAGFNVGHAMQRNKFIYALADASLVVQAEVGKGGTWAGAMEQLERYHFGTLYVRTAPEAEPAATELQQRGALAWPEPVDRAAGGDVFEASAELPVSPQGALLDACEKGDEGFSEVRDGHKVGDAEESTTLAARSSSPCGSSERDVAAAVEGEAKQEGRTEAVPLALAAAPKASERVDPSRAAGVTGDPAVFEAGDDEVSDALAPADALFATARTLIIQQLNTEKTETAVAEALGIQPAQAKAWLVRLVEEGALEKRTRPVRYVVREPALFE